MRAAVVGVALGLVACRGEPGRSDPGPPAALAREANAIRGGGASAAEAVAVAAAPAATPAFERPAPGGLIAFVAEVDGRRVVHLVDPAGPPGGERVLAGPEGSDVYPVARAGDALVAVAAWPEGEGRADHREALVLLPLDGGAPRVVFEAGKVRNPSVTGDGAIAVLESDRDSYRDLFAIDLERGTARRLTDAEGGSFEPAVAADGRSVAYASSRTGDAEIFIQPLSRTAPPSRGQPPSRGADHRGSTPEARRLTAFHRDDWSPRMSPAGDLIAFVSARERRDRIYLVAPDGTGTRPLGPPWDAEGEAAPAFSPDGGRLAFVAGHAGDVGLYVADVASGARRRLSPPGVRPSQPAFSPDGRHLVYVEDAAGAPRLRLVATAGGADVVLATRTAAWLPRWLRSGAAAAPPVGEAGRAPRR